MKLCNRNWSASSSTSSLHHITRLEGQLPGPKHLRVHQIERALASDKLKSLGMRTCLKRKPVYELLFLMYSAFAYITQHKDGNRDGKERP